MAIDVASRFPRTSLADALKRAAESEPWIFPDLVSSSITMFYGRSNVGKSYLVASLLLSLMVEGRNFLGMPPTDPGKEWRPTILCTDPGSEEEYAARLATGLPDDVDVDVPMYFVGVTRTAEEWNALTDHLVSEGNNFVVLDNLIGATGDSNDQAAGSAVFDGLSRLVSRGVPVVLLNHESEHAGTTRRGAPPMGMSMSVQKARAWVQVRKTDRRKLRGGNLGLYVQSNRLDADREIIARPLAGPDFEVIETHALDEEGNPQRQRQDRDPATLDRNAAVAAFVVEKCQGKTVRATAEILAKEFAGKAETFRARLRRGNALGSLIEHNEDNRWTWVSAG